jgi:hypothetical protein
MAICDDTTKRAVLKLLKRGQVSPMEAARLSGRSHQIVAYWARDLPDARPAYLEKLWLRATRRPG